MSDQDEGGGGGGGVSTAGFYLLNTDIIISFIKPLGLIVCSQFIQVFSPIQIYNP